MDFHKHLLLPFAAVGLAAGLVMAETDTLNSSLTLGLTVTDGNSETILGNAALLTEGSREPLGALRAGIEGSYGESTQRTTEVIDGEERRVRETTTNVENLRGFGNVRKTLSERTFAYLDGSALYDGIADIDYRFIIGPGVGTYLLKRPRTQLSLEVGPSYIWERVSETRDDYIALRLAERLDHAFSETARFWQSVELLPKADDFDSYLVGSEIGVEADMTTRLSLRVVAQSKYDNAPGEGKQNHDLSLIAGLRASL